MRYWRLSLAMLALFAVLLAGCGGGGPAGNMSAGGVGVTVNWPALPAGVQPQLIPLASNSIKVEIVRNGVAIAGKVVVINRPQTTARIDGVEVGEAILRATAYPQANAGGVAQAGAEIGITVVANQYTEWPITMQSTITKVDVTPNPASVPVGEDRTLTATAKNAAGQTVLVRPANAFTWTLVGGGAYASLSPAGVAHGIAIGSATVKAKENESGIESQPITVTVSNGYLPADLSEALGMPLATAPVPGSPANLAALSSLQDDSNRPHDNTELRTELGVWVAAVRANPNDAAAQLGLALAILAASSHDAAEYAGFNLFPEVNITQIAQVAFSPSTRVDRFAEDAFAVMAGANVAQVRGGTNNALHPAQAVASSGPPSVSDLVTYRRAAREFLVPGLNSARDRFNALTQNVSAATLLVSLTSTRDGATYHAYAADFHALAASMEVTRCGVLMVSALNPDYGSYNWDLNLAERDANQDGMLSLNEYLPPTPFGDIDRTWLVGAGDALSAALGHAKSALQGRQSGDAAECVNKAIAGQNVSELQGYINDAISIMAGQVTVTARFYNWRNESPWDLVPAGTDSIPFNLGQLWRNPSANIRACLPPLYLMPSASGQGFRYQNASASVQLGMAGEGVNPGGVRPASLVDGTLGRSVAIQHNGTTVFQGGVQIPIGVAPHRIVIPAGTGFAGADLTFNYNWTSATGTVDGVAVALNTVPGSDTSLDAQTTWNDLPDKTLSGVFPDSTKLHSLLVANYAQISYEYGSIMINGVNTLPARASQR